MFGFGRRGFFPFMDFYGDPWGVDRSGFADVSQHALRHLEEAKTDLKNLVQRADVSNGPVTGRLNNQHLVTECRKRFKAFCDPHGIKLNWDKESKKGRQSQVWMPRVTITAEAKRRFLEAHKLQDLAPPPAPTAPATVAQPIRTAPSAHITPAHIQPSPMPSALPTQPSRVPLTSAPTNMPQLTPPTNNTNINNFPTTSAATNINAGIKRPAIEGDVLDAYMNMKRRASGATSAQLPASYATAAPMIPASFPTTTATTVPASFPMALNVSQAPSMPTILSASAHISLPLPVAATNPTVSASFATNQNISQAPAALPASFPANLNTSKPAAAPAIAGALLPLPTAPVSNAHSAPLMPAHMPIQLHVQVPQHAQMQGVHMPGMVNAQQMPMVHAGNVHLYVAAYQAMMAQAAQKPNA